MADHQTRPPDEPDGTQSPGVGQLSSQSTQPSNILPTSVDHYHSLFEHVPIGLCRTTPDGQFEIINPALVRLLGFPDQATLRATNLVNLYVDLSVYQQGRTALECDGGLLNLTAQVRRFDGAALWVRQYFQVVPAQEGQPQYYDISWEDITDQRTTEETLRESEGRFRLLFEAAPDAYYLSDLTGTFLDGNRVAERMIGYAREELIGKNFLEIGVLPTEQVAVAAELLLKNMEGLPTGPDELTLNRKDGAQVEVEIRTFPIHFNGQAIVLGIARDISARKRAETQLRYYAEQQQRYAVELEQRVAERTAELTAAEAKLRELVESSPDGIILTNAAGQIILVNQQTENLFGYQREELLGQLVEVLVPEPLRTAHVAHRARYFSRPYRRPMGAYLNLYGLRKDGSQFPVGISLSPVVPNGETWVINSVRDISDQRHFEEQLRLSAERLGLLHDIDQAILSGQTPETIAIVTLRRLRQLVPCRRTGVVLIDFVNKEATLLAVDVGGETLLTPGLRGPVEAVQISTIDVDALLQGHQYEIDDLSTLADLPVAIQALQAEGVRALLVTPLVTEGELIGVLNLGKGEPKGFTPAQKEIVREIANQLALALQRARDITARQLAEEAVRISEQQYRLLFAQNPHPMWVYDVETLAFLAVNETASRHYGYTREEFLAMTLLDIRPPEETETFLATIERVREDNSLTSLQRHQKKDGTLIQVEESSNEIQFAGRAARVVLAHDETARLRAEAELQEEVEITAALVRVGRNMISSLDTPTIVQQLCEIVVDVLGCDCCHVALLDTKSNAFINTAGSGDTSEQWELLRLSPIPRGALATLEDQFLDGEETQAVRVAIPARSVLDAVLQQAGIRTALFVPLRRGAQIIGVLSAAYRSDHEFSVKQQRLAKGTAQVASLALTNARLVEELEEVNRLKDDFVGAMSHELRTPLNVILGYTELLLEDTYGVLSMDQSAALQRVDQHARELVDLVNNLLDINRLRTRRISLHLGEIGVDVLFAQLKVEVPVGYQKPTVDLQWQCEPIPFPLYTDPVKLKVVLKNLINNALKFTDKGTVTVAARLKNAGIEFSVSDTGIGIPPEHLPLIFEAFRQVDNSSTRSYGGVGLGLYIARQLLDLLGGSITVDSTPSKGSTFRVWIPVRLHPDDGD